LWRRRKHIVLIRRHCVWKLYTEINDLRNKMLPTYISNDCPLHNSLMQFKKGRNGGISLLVGGGQAQTHRWYLSSAPENVRQL